MTNPNIPRAASQHVTGWHLFVDLGGRQVVAQELADALRAPHPKTGEAPTQSEKTARYAEWMALKGRAESGDLEPESDEWDPVASQPTLWELRLHETFGRPGLRVYFSEPQSFPGVTVVAGAHMKPRTMTRDEQNKHMEQAAARVRDGAGWLWGCQECPKPCCRNFR